MNNLLIFENNSPVICNCLLEAGVRGVRGVRAALGVRGVRGVRGELPALPFLLEGDPNTLKSVFPTHASVSAADLIGLLEFSLSSSQNFTGESNLAALYAHSVSMSKLNLLMNRFRSRAYCSCINRLVSSRSGAPKRHLQLPRRLLGVLDTFLRAAIPMDISNLLCLGVRPPAAIAMCQVSLDWFARNIWLISRENSCCLQVGSERDDVVTGACERGRQCRFAPGGWAKRANSNLKCARWRARVLARALVEYDWAFPAHRDRHAPAHISALGANAKPLTMEPRTLFASLRTQVK